MKEPALLFNYGQIEVTFASELLAFCFLIMRVGYFNDFRTKRNGLGGGYLTLESRDDHYVCRTVLGIT